MQPSLCFSDACPIAKARSAVAQSANALSANAQSANARSANKVIIEDVIY